MSETQPNLFSSLFQWRPREGKLSAENFLTESFVYCLLVNEPFRFFWLGKILGRDIGAEDLFVNTRASHVDDERKTTIYPDIDIRGKWPDGTKFALIIEVKWGAPYDKEQIRKYDQRLIDEANPFLILISPSRAECQRATQDGESLYSSFQAIQWATVYSDLSMFSEHCRATKELEEFMDQQGLSPGKSLSSQEIDHYVASRNFIKGLKRYCEKLLHEYNWKFLPPIYQELERPSVTDRSGRVAIEFQRSQWNGTITIGFLYSNEDHRVKFADGSNNSVDLMMRLECAPKTTGRDSVISVLRQYARKAEALGGTVHVAGDPGNANRHTLLIAQSSLSKFLEKPDEASQLSAMHAQIEAWAGVLFETGELDRALANFDNA